MSVKGFVLMKVLRLVKGLVLVKGLLALSEEDEEESVSKVESRDGGETETSRGV